MLKVLADPLPMLLAVQLFLLALYWIGFRSRVALAILLITALALAAFSMPVVADLLQRSLTLPVSTEDPSPDYIVVLSGGSDEGISSDLDALSTETTKRVLFGVRAWKHHPSARLVMTGAGPEENPARETELMADLARCRGVPASSIIIEPKAANTREHPRRLRALPGFGPASRVVVVTSGWHERRAMIEFRRYFMNVTANPMPLDRHEALIDWVPDVGGLTNSTAATREWVAIIWYKVLSLAEKHRSPVRIGECDGTAFSWQSIS